MVAINHRGAYRRPSSINQFVHSGVGITVIIVAAIALLALLCMLTVPSDDYMQDKTANAIALCIKDNAKQRTDNVDDAVRNTEAIIATADTIDLRRAMNEFTKYNRVEVFRHKLFATSWIFSNFHPEGRRAGIGILGIMVPVLHYDDFFLNPGPIRKEYNQPAIRTYNYGDDYMGSDPDLGNTFNTYEGDGTR